MSLKASKPYLAVRPLFGYFHLVSLKSLIEWLNKSSGQSFITLCVELQCHGILENWCSLLHTVECMEGILSILQFEKQSMGKCDHKLFSSVCALFKMVGYQISWLAYPAWTLTCYNLTYWYILQNRPGVIIIKMFIWRLSTVEQWGACTLYVQKAVRICGE